MARHSGKDGKFKIGSAFVTGLRSYDITETAATVDTTAAGDAWDAHVQTRKSWTASVTVLLDNADTAQAIRAGTAVDIEAYGEGDGSGKVFLSGSATVTSVGRPLQFDAEMTLAVELQGNGELARETVA